MYLCISICVEMSVMKRGIGSMYVLERGGREYMGGGDEIDVAYVNVYMLDGWSWGFSSWVVFSCRWPQP